jgi:glycosyltransferase involved in cell wall biosynthesis
MRTDLVTVIVPAYNEEKTVGEVVRVTKESPDVFEVIVVSDGSVDQTAAEARNAGARVIELKENLGKGQAMLKGVEGSQTQFVVFFDADLYGLTSHHVEKLVRSVLSGRKKMNVGLRNRGRFMNLFVRHMPLISGIRAMDRAVIESIKPKYLKGFMVESALNYACRVRGFKYGTVALHGVKIRHKYEKVWLGAAVIQYLKMGLEIAKAIIAVRLAHIKGNF